MNPTVCGSNNGQIKLYGLVPGILDTIYYKYNGVLQAYLSELSLPDSSLTISGLCIGVYDSIVVKVGDCHTPPYGPIILTSPPLLVGPATTVDASRCGICDGSITVSGLMPNQMYILNYTKNTLAQPPLSITTTTSGTILLTGLCAGIYNSITFSLNSFCAGITCATPPIGPLTINEPAISNSFTQSTKYGCKGDTVTFVNNSTTVGPLYYIWNFGDGTSDTSTNPSHIYAQGIYTVTLVATNLHCSQSSSLTDSLIHPLTAAFSDSPNIICQGDAITFTNKTDVLSTAPLSYAWNFGDGGTGNSTSPVYTFPHSGVYDVRLIATNFVPCHDTAYDKVYVDSISPVSINVTDSVLCRSGYVTFTGIYTTIGNTGVTWDFGDGDSVLNLNPVSHAYDVFGTKFVTITAHYRACKSLTTSQPINIFQQPGLDLGADTTICPGGVPLTISDKINAKNPGAKWKWNTGQTSSSIAVTAPGFYSLIVDVHGCQASDTVWVQNDCYLNIPNVFSPNGDGENDYFFPRQYLAKGLISFKMDIYNRWGQLIFESATLDGSGWDGRLNGENQPTGVYIYTIDATFKDGQKEHHQGNITLLR
jgi:gliding motility-associated-like protein